MTTSTTTALELANVCLNAIGERGVSNFSGSVGTRALNAINSAIRELEAGGDWVWQEQEMLLSSWAGTRATYPGGRVLYVSVKPSASGRASLLLPVTPEEMALLRLPGATGVPIYYCLRGDAGIEVYPEPSDEAIKTSMRVFGYQPMSTVSAPTDKLPVPEMYLGLLEYRVKALLAESILGDTELAAKYESQWSSYMHRVRNRRTNVAPGGRNMYGGISKRIRRR